MGIKNLHTFLRKKIPETYKTFHISELSGKKLAIDTSIFMCKFKNSCGNRWLEGFYNLVLYLKDYNINFIFVLDSKAPPEKELEREQRILMRERNKTRVDTILDEWKLCNDKYPTKTSFEEEELSGYPTLKPFLDKKKCSYPLSKEDIIKYLCKLQKNIISISGSDFDLLKSMFDLMNVSYYHADSEAEGTCSLMNRKGLVDGVLTEDTDVMAYGTPNMYFGLNLRDGMIHHLCRDDILERLQISFSQLRDFCIMCGTDYNTNIDKVGPIKSFDLIYQNISLEKITEKMDTSVLNFERVRDLFNCDKYELDINEINTIDKLNIYDNSLYKFCFYNNIKYQKLNSQ